MLLRILGLFLHLVARLHSKLFLQSAAGSEMSQTERSLAEILNTSLRNFDNFTFCARNGSFYVVFINSYFNQLGLRLLQMTRSDFGRDTRNVWF